MIPQNKEQKIADKDLDTFGFNFFYDFEQRNAQVTSLLMIYQNFNDALKFLKDAKDTITNFQPSNQHEKQSVAQIRYGIEFSADIVQTARDIVYNLNSLFFIINTHRQYVGKILEQKRLNPDPKAQEEQRKSGNPDLKNQKRIICDGITTAKKLYVCLLKEHTPVVPNSEQVRYI
jgi:hypothetical protein